MLDAVKRVTFYSNSLEKVKRILARVTRGWKQGKSIDVLKLDPIALELLEAERLILFSSMPETYVALEKGRLDSLMPVRDGLIIVTTGRLGESSLSRLLGVASLPILMSSSRAAYLFMLRAHCGDRNMLHRSAVDTLARSRSSVWIVKGMCLAKSIVKHCPVCVRDRKLKCSQQIAKIKPENLEV